MAKKTTTEGLVSILGDILSDDYMDKAAKDTTSPKNGAYSEASSKGTKTARAKIPKQSDKKSDTETERVSDNSPASDKAKIAPASKKEKTSKPGVKTARNRKTQKKDSVAEQSAPQRSETTNYAGADGNHSSLETVGAFENAASKTQMKTIDMPQRPDENSVESHANQAFHKNSPPEPVRTSTMEKIRDFGSQRSGTPWHVEQKNILEQVKKHQITAAEGYRLIAGLLQKHQDLVNHLPHATGGMAAGYFEEKWEETRLDTRENPKLFHRILFFDTDGVAGKALAAGLKIKNADARVIVVRPGSSFREVGPDNYEVNPVVKDDYWRLVQSLAERNMLPDKIIHWWSRTAYDGKELTLQRQFDHGLYALLYITQAFMKQKTGQKVTLDYVYNSFGVQPQYAAVSGYVKSLRLENPDFSYKTVEIQIPTAEAGQEFYTAAAEILAGEIAYGGNDIEVRYSGERRLVRQYQKIEIPYRPEDGAEQFKKKGVYLITGGAGGLGLIFAEYLAKKVAATLILVGRSELTANKKRKISELKSFGSEVIYIQADISKKSDVDKLISTVKSRFYRIDGVIHSAGVYQNDLIMKKSKEEMDTVLTPKVWGAVRIDEALQDEPLDFFIVCSSLAGEFGKIGQSDYAFGNYFLDSFAKMREQLRKQNKRHGKTASIDWPLWEEGGMTLENEERRLLWERMGMEALPTREGLACVDFAVRYRHAQVIVTYGDQSRIAPYFIRANKQPETPMDLPRQTMTAKDLYDPTEALLKEILANEIGLSVDKLNSSTNFENYGIDSIVVNHFNAEIEKKLGALPKTLLFEYHNVKELSEYLAKNQTAKLAGFFGPAKSESEHGSTAPVTRGWAKLIPICSQQRIADDHAQTGLSQTEAMAADAATEMEIAIIGLNGRYPGARNVQEFWVNLCAGKDCITEIPPQRWDRQKYYDSNFDNVKEGKMYCKWGGFIEDFDKFEPLFFNISPREAESMDPQERIFLETVWGTLEDAGYNFNKLRKLAPKDNGLDVGVFVGATTNTYPQVAMEEWAKGNMVTFRSSPWSIANRVSYVFNFQGPSIPVDTACSSALVAIHLACESLRKGECSMAVAGGVNLYLHPSKYIGMCQAKMLSPTGICRSFGENADGMVPGEGVGAILLKPLRRAVADQDHIYAVLKGSTVNHGGKTNGYSVPNPNAQARLIMDAFQKSGIDPRTISYIEAHGTGTALGDPIEIAGLTKAVRRYTDKKQFCAIGSVKSNIGHLEAASGIAGLTKILLQMQYRQLLPSIHAERLNPNIDFGNSPFFVQRELGQWLEPVVKDGNKTKIFPRRAGISSFGAGGSNAHILLEEYPKAPRYIPATAEPQLFLLSAKNETRLKQYAKRLLEFLQAKPLGNMADTAVNPSLIMAVSDQVQYALENDDLFPFQENEEYQEAFQIMERLGRELLWHTFRKMGVFISPGEQYTFRQLRSKLGIDAKYHRIYEALTDILVRAGFIQMDDDRITAPKVQEEPDFQAEHDRLEEQKIRLSERYPEIASYLHLIWVCVHSYPDVLTGKEDYTEVMFPGGSMELVENIYRGNKMVDYYNRLVALEIDEYIRKRLAEDPRAKIKILEIGAGTGGTSTFVMEKIKSYADNITYVYTDISLGFTQYGKRHFGAQYPFLEFKVLNVENPIEEQGFIPESVDVIFATNVIHATRNIQNTFRQIQSLLAANGIVVLNEITKIWDFSTLTFGLTTGWWLFEDKAIRVKNAPFLSPENWKRQLEQTGFGQIHVLGMPHSITGDAGQHLIVGEKNKPEENPVISGRSDINPADLAYTLQVGREPMDERLAVIASDLGSLIQSLARFIKEQTVPANAFRGSRKRNKETLPLPSEDHLSQMLQNREFQELGGIWARGTEVDWFELYPNEHPRVISLPTYPFNGQRYWFPQAGRKPDSQGQTPTGRLHPLVHQNISTMGEQKFSTTLIGTEFFTDDHRVNGRKVLSDTAFMEMALAAGNLSANRPVSGMKNLVWAKPVILEETPAGILPFSLNISLYPGRDEVKYQVWSGAGSEKRRIHAHGGLIYASESEMLESSESIDLDALKKRLSNSMDGQTCYRLYEKTGLRYGLRLRAIRKIYYRESEALSVLELPAPIEPEFENYQLNPALMEGALQSIIALKGADTGEKANTYVPFALGEVRIYGSLPKKCFAYVIMQESSKDGPVKRYDVSITDETGEVRVSMKNFSFRRLEPESKGTIHEDMLLQKIQQDFSAGVAEILKINPEEIDIETDLSEYGFDSVTFTQYSNLLNEKFNLGIMPSILFEYRTLTSFSKAMLAQYKPQFLKAYQDPAVVVLPEKQTVLETKEPVPSLSKSEGTLGAMKLERLLPKLQRDLLAGVAKILEISEEDLDIGTEMSEFGFDAVTFAQFSNLLNNQFNLEITSSQFFEHRSLDSFAREMLKKYGEQLSMYYQGSSGTVASAAQVDATTTVVENSLTPQPQFVNSKTAMEPVPIRTSDEDSVAIVGMSGVMPQSENPEEFWNNIESGEDLITEIPANRWDWRDWYGDIKEDNKTNIKWGGFMKEVDKFDAQFFGISPREAEMMDPQQRIFLEVVWKTIEDAGYKASELAGTKTGLFVGVSSADYADLLKESGIPIQAQTATGNFHSVLPNRISYMLDFHGPSEPVDTACSSSLVAIHRAVEAIRNGNCPTAIAGGINVIASPSTYLTLSKAGMLCEDGRCKTFDKRANGYVRGEGAAAILLKPLHRALAEGDHIYGVIRGTAVNHGGHTNSLTAPNPMAQADLLIEAWRKAGVDPRRVTYIEAHGTGTGLGDPIEINGLKKAFEQLYRDWNCDKPGTHYCGLGSVKTNIGHLESASGIAGIMKVLLAMKHGKLPGNINFQERNPYIQLQDSPFYIVDKSRPWERLHDETGAEIPRVAGVSSFGFSGVNAHIVIEEGTMPAPTAYQEAGRGYLIVLSAKNAERLRAYADRVRVFLEDNPKLSDAYLENIAYTLQTGREAMEERLAWVISNIQELKEALTAYCSGQTFPGMIQGNIRANKGKSDTAQKGSGKESLDGRIRRREFIALAQLWVKGADIDWKGLYRKPLPTRLSLPVYPFAKERYWLPRNVKPVSRQTGQKKLHVLIDSNESTLEEQCYRKTFNGEEFFIKDHSSILPGVVYIEMLRAAGNLANRLAKVKKMENIIWVTPIAVSPGEPKQVSIGLYPDGDQVRFEVSTRADDAKTVHCQGSLIYENGSGVKAQPEFVDVTAVKERCRGGKDEADAYYHKLEGLGIHFGHRFKGIQAFYYNRNEALSEVGIPPELEAGVKDYLLHPTMTDAGLQTVVGWAYHNGANPNTIFMPFVLGEIEFVHPEKRIAYVYTRKAPGQEQFDAVASCYQVWLLDRQGQVIVKLNDYSLSALKSDKAKESMEKASAAELVYARSSWRMMPQKSLDPIRSESMGTLLLFDLENHTAARLRKILSGIQQVILVKPGKSFRELQEDTFEICPTSPEDYRKLLELLEETKKIPQKVLHLWSQGPLAGGENDLDDQLARGINSLFYLSGAYLETQPGLAVKLLYVYFEAPCGKQDGDMQYFIQPQYSAVSGFAKTNSMENPDLHIKTIGCRTGDAPDSFSAGDLAWMLGEFAQTNPDEIELRYQDGERWVRTWQEYIPETAPRDGLPLRERGVYLITGGAGGLGLIFAGYLARKCRARLVLTGRTAVLPPDKLAKIKELEAAGAQVTYLSADLSSRPAVMELISRVKQQFPEIHGIIHGAGVIRDSFIREKSPADFKAVLSPKVDGAVYLDEATRDEPLDFFAMFSSVTAVTGNAGQSDYAYANSFLDGFAAWRAQQKRPGKAFSINWPLWMNGGMQVDKKIQNMLADLGMTPISSETGLNAFETALGESMTQFTFLQGEPSKLRRLLRLEIPEPDLEFEDKPQSDSEHDESLLPLIQKEMIRIMAGILKYDEAKLKFDDNLSSIGFDSITLTELANHMNEKFKMSITPALFFKHTTPEALASCLFSEHYEPMAQYFRKKSPPAEKVSQTPARPKIPSIDGFSSRFETFDQTQNRRTEGNAYPPEPVAVIGMSGVMPQSDNLEEFWSNIESGRDLITEIPRERWNWQAIYGEPTGESFQTNIKWGGFMREVDKFDPLFFGIAPRDAELMDPQERIMIEVVWKAIGNAGYKAQDFSETKTGLFIGVSNADYQELLIKENRTPVLTHSLLPNRISYLLNIHGPSEPVDTACSSSLVAIHRAVEAIQLGNCEMALAGGINIIASPNLYVYESASGMLSPDGRCKTFDKRANGYVRGEGAGAILLKPLQKALADGDHIYAVIKATCVNHGGHATSLTAPNAAAQAELLTSAYKKAGIDPSTVSYIETHGTGTGLGDPVEIDALKDAFLNLYREWNLPAPQKPHCGLGAVKTNIGHLESASGIAGFLKTILALKYKKLPPIVHFKELNPYIKLDGSPFYIVQHAQPWEKLKDSSGREIPRRAGISSFGIGGVNAHIVLEEYENPADVSGPYSGPPQILVFSAKNQERLNVYITSMLDEFQKMLAENGEDLPDRFLPNIAYTLQAGRDPMEERLALVVSSLQELTNKLQQYQQGKPDIQDLFSGNSKKSQEKTPFLSQGKGWNSFVQSLVREGEYPQIAQLWVTGNEIDWKLCHEGQNPGRVPLPTYPFAKERYWLPSVDTVSGAMKQQGIDPAEKLHPCIDRNTSTLREQKFSTILSGDEYYLRDHVIGKRKILPGAVYLETARAAAEIAGEQPVAKLRNILWTQPFVAGDAPQTLDICLYPEHNGVTVEFVSHAGDEPIIHAQGQAIFAADRSEKANDEIIDIEAIKQRCVQTEIDDTMYQELQKIGVEFGMSFRTQRYICVNESEALSYLELPQFLRDDIDDYGLHPALIDGALQTAARLTGGFTGGTGAVLLPFAIEELEFFGPLPVKCFAYATLSKTEPPVNSGLQKFDIRIASADGRVVAKIKKYAVREFHPSKAEDSDRSKPAPKNSGNSAPDETIRNMLSRLENGELRVEEVNRLLEGLE